MRRISKGFPVLAGTAFFMATAGSLLFCLAGSAEAQPPEGYWDSIDTSSPETLATSIHNRIRNHVLTPYSSSNWPILEAADAHPELPGHVLDFYRNAAVPLPVDSTRPYDREHVWPQSRGFPDGGTWSTHARADMHNLFICDRNYNNSRGNNFMAFCPAPGCDERPTEFSAGAGGGTGVYPGNSNWRSSATWEVWNGRKGDAARAIMYMAARYKGGTHANGSLEPDLRLTNDTTLFATGAQPIAYMGLLDDLMAWHLFDPPDAKEQARHDVIAAAQQNRNPFIDFPEWAPCYFLGECADVAPMRPLGLVASNDGLAVLLSWEPRPETNLTGYYVYRAPSLDGPFSRLTTTPTPLTSFADNTVLPNVANYYVVTAINEFGNESQFSAPVTQTLGDKVLIAQESFETEQGYTIVGGTGAFSSPVSFFGRFNTRPSGMVTAVAGTDGNFFIAGANTNAVSPPLPADGIHTVVIDPINIRGFANLEIHLAVNARGVNAYDSVGQANGDYLQLLVEIDNGGDTIIGQFTKMAPRGSNGRLGRDLNLNGEGDVEIQDYTRFEDYVFVVPETVGNLGKGDSLRVRIRTRFDAATEEIAYDNVRVYGTPLGVEPEEKSTYFVTY